MPVSKRTRYEVLKRDNYTCRYCGGVAPDVVLTVDHVLPVALGGSDDPSNLVAACKDCNAGKGSTAPDAQVVIDVGEADMRWAEAVKRAAERAVAESKGRSDRHQWFVDEWSTWHTGQGKPIPLPNGWDKSIDHWTGAGLPREILLECIDIAMAKNGVDPAQVFAYMGGIARKKLEQIHETARELLDNEERPDGA